MNNFIKAAEAMAKENEELRAKVAALEAQLGEAHTITAPAKRELREVVAPLVIKLNDNTLHNCSTYRKVYSNIDVDWGNEIASYMSKFGVTKVPSKYDIVSASAVLFADFERIVAILLAE